MATTTVTVTVTDEHLARIRERVDAGQASSVSSFVQEAVSAALGDVAAWAHSVAEMLHETGGPLTDEEQAWADSVLGVSAGPAATGSAA